MRDGPSPLTSPNVVIWPRVITSHCAGHWGFEGTQATIPPREEPLGQTRDSPYGFQREEPPSPGAGISVSRKACNERPT